MFHFWEFLKTDKEIAILKAINPAQWFKKTVYLVVNGRPARQE